MDKKIVVFEDQNVRRVWHNNEWWFVLEDVIIALTNSRDPKQYINKIYNYYMKIFIIKSFI